MPKHWVGAAALLACIAGSAIAQEAVQGAAGVTLTAEQIATPHVVSVPIGARPGYRRIEGCSGHFPEGVTYELNLQAASGAALVAAARSTADTTLYIEGPGGLHACDDDTMDWDPRIELSNAPSGLYRLWVGTYSSTQSAGTASLVLTTDRNWPPSGLQHEAEPRDGPVELSAGFWPDPHFVRDIDVGGAFSIDLWSNDACYGSTEPAPNVRLHFRAGLRPTQLVIDLDSATDGTLAVRTPGGTWVCDDDSGAGLNPRVVLRPAETGDYVIYAASLRRAAQGVLSISESMPVVHPDLSATPSVRALSLAADVGGQSWRASRCVGRRRRCAGTVRRTHEHRATRRADHCGRRTFRAHASRQCRG